MTSPKRIALTGGIAMGKSTVAAMFVEAGVPVFDADAEVHRLYAPGGALVAPVAALFPDVCDARGGIDRAKLSAAVLNDPAAMAALEALVHPGVRTAAIAFTARHADAPALLFDIPLLFESGQQALYDIVVTVSCPPDVQRARALARPGMTPARLDAILARQASDAVRRAGADHVVDTGGSLADTRAQVAAILACILPEARR